MRDRVANVGVAFLLSGLVLAGCSSSTVSGSPSRSEPSDGGAKPAIRALGGPCTSGGACDPGLYCASGVRLCVPMQGSGGATSSGLGGGTFVANNGGSSSGGAFSQGGAGGVGLFGGGGASGSGGAAGGTGACGFDHIASGALPVDLYVMFDKSSSMGDPLPDNSGTWWSAAQAALTSFVTDGRSSGMGVGLQYFPLSDTLPACTLKSPVGDCCSSNVYQTPDVPVGLLPGNAAALTASIQSTQPTAFTPTSAALQGAIDYMKAWAPSHPGRAPVVVLVTDGFPTECSPGDLTAGVNPVDLAAQAKTAFETDPKVRTAVIGFNLGPGGANLDQIAQAGGTSKAFLIDNGDVGAAFVSAMLGITNAPLSCQLGLPKPASPGVTVDPNLLSVVYTPSATNVPTFIAKVSTFGDCALNANEGFYFDSASAPTKILLCPGTCGGLAAGTLQVVAGCAPPLP